MSGNVIETHTDKNLLSFEPNWLGLSHKTFLTATNWNKEVNLKYGCGEKIANFRVCL